MSEIIKKEFIDVNEETKWLDEQGEKKLILVGCKVGEYEFENGEEEYVYKIENIQEVIEKAKFKNKEAYIKFLKERNIDVVGELEEKIYLRRRKAETQPSKPDVKDRVLKKDNAVSNSGSKKSKLYFIIGASQLALASKFVIDMIKALGIMGTKFFLPMFLAIIFIISGLMFIIAGLHLERKNLSDNQKNIN